MRSKRIYFDRQKTRYVVCRLFKYRNEMRTYYSKSCPNDKNHNDVLGVNIAREYYVKKGKKWLFSKQTGEVLLNLQDCGVGVVTHEFMHAVLWARNFKEFKKQYPIVIKDMADEEHLLHEFTYIVRQFYNWYWDVKKKIKAHSNPN